MALLQGWSDKTGRRKLRHIWKKNKQLRLFFMTEWKPLVISRRSVGQDTSRVSMAAVKVMKPHPSQRRLQERKTVFESSFEGIQSAESSSTGICQLTETGVIFTSGRAYSDLGREVDAGKGLKTCVLNTDTSWIDFCSACGKKDALEYYHVDGSYRLCSQKCFREYVNRRKLIFKIAQQSIFSRKYSESGCNPEKDWKENHDSMKLNDTNLNEVRMRDSEMNRIQTPKRSKRKWKSFVRTTLSTAQTIHENRHQDSQSNPDELRSSPKKIKHDIAGTLSGLNISKKELR